MWSPLSKTLEFLAAWRLPWLATTHELRVGDPEVGDALGGFAWRERLDPRRLAKIWGPREDGPWWPFHCLTLFAARDSLRTSLIGPLDHDPFPVARMRRPDWLDERTLLFIDLPGVQSVALGAGLALRGCDLVCTFNNWPHPKGLIPSERVLAALIRYASLLDAERVRPETPAPVAWLCDAGRLGTATGKPGDFDNRYYIEESSLPGVDYLRARGISRIAHLGTDGAAVLGDLAQHLLEYRTKGFEVVAARLGLDGPMEELRALELPTAPFRTGGFLVAAGGGFGATVPHPSSGGG